MTPVERVIVEAERTLRSILRASPDGTPDPRWQAVIRVGELLPSHPDEVWAFASRWGCSPDPDLRSAIATCLIEHLLEHHFQLIFPRVKELASTDVHFADTAKKSWSFAETWHPEELRQWRAFQERLNHAG